MMLKRKSELQGITVKKYKGTMETFDKKSDTRNHQHNEDSHAKNIIIECVNDDCLSEIFTYVPTCERPKIALVCKKWKRALVNSWFNVKKIELTYWRYHKYPTCLNKYQTSNEKFNFLKPLLDKCGRYLTVLDLTDYGHCDIVPVVNDSCQNLVELRLRFISIDDRMLSNAFTHLSKLKSLTIIFEHMKDEVLPLTLINSLRNVANTLMELKLLNFIDHTNDICDYPKEFDCVIRELKVLKNLEVAGIRDFENILEDQLSNDMSFYFNHNRYVQRPPYLGNQLIYFRSVNLTSFCVTDDTLYTIANTIKLLGSLYIPCKLVTDKGVVALSKMENLQYIYFFDPSNITDSSIKLLKNLVKVRLPQSKKITDVSVIKIIENSPKISRVCIQHASVTAEFFKKAAEISNNRKQLLKYDILPLLPNIKQYENQYFKRSFNLEDYRKEFIVMGKNGPRTLSYFSNVQIICKKHG